MKLSYPKKRLLSAIEANPGFSRAELAKLLYVGEGGVSKIGLFWGRLSLGMGYDEGGGCENESR